MPAKDHFISRGIQQTEIDTFLARELSRAGYAGVDIQKTPLGTRIIIQAARPGMVIGRSGRNVKELTTILEEKYGLENPQIEVDEIEIPELNARVMAAQLVQKLERGDQFRRAGYSILRRVMGAGAKGVEIKISGKLTSQRARYQKFVDGVISKAGEPADIFVDAVSIQANMKPGILGVSIKIMRPDIKLPDDVKIIPREQITEEKAPKLDQGETKEESAWTEAGAQEVLVEESKEQVSEVVGEVDNKKLKTKDKPAKKREKKQKKEE